MNLELSGGSALLQYVDELMICSPTQAACKKDTVLPFRKITICTGTSDLSGARDHR